MSSSYIRSKTDAGSRDLIFLQRSLDKDIGSKIQIKKDS